MRISDWSSDVCSSDVATALLPILETPDPRLRTISTPVETIDDDLQQLIDDMFETMYDAPGIGLAAIQVGVPTRRLVIDLQEPDKETGEAVWKVGRGSGREGGWQDVRSSVGD